MRSMENLEKPSSTEMMNILKRVWKSIATAVVSGSAFEAANNGFIRKTDRIIMNKDYIINEAKKTVLAMFDNGFTPLQKKHIPVLGTKGRAVIQYDIDFMRSGKFISDYRCISG